MGTTKEILDVLWQSMKDLWGELLILVLMNLVTMAPVILIVFLFYEMAVSWASGQQALVITFAVLHAVPLILFPPTLAGLWNVANRVADGLAIHWSDYFEGFRLYFWKSLGLALINVLVLAILLSNIWFYTPGNNPLNLAANVNSAIQIAFILLTIMWLVYQMYPLAMLLEQKDQRLRTTLRNTGVLFITRPGFNILLALMLAIVIAVSTYLLVPWFVVTLAFIAIVCNKAVKHLLIPHRERAAEQAASEAQEAMHEEQPE
jgi:hypothetical protein